jgi:hypothetical protein
MPEALAEVNQHYIERIETEWRQAAELVLKLKAAMLATDKVSQALSGLAERPRLSPHGRCKLRDRSHAHSQQYRNEALYGAARQAGPAGEGVVIAAGARRKHRTTVPSPCVLHILDCFLAVIRYESRLDLGLVQDRLSIPTAP